ncbi:fructosamine kinase family protein [Rhodocaloribacter litoris]|uniref:fructosamine kinase family protein n=1 Tax=Rhodocaloribacter litoris TaxID=2558931 RepID=UPI00141E31EF|nr:fructosamine kinase family protein [Rhodocaloribacter litoris]QXD14845.1 fructosamine kinase family protein [Rhodocaloribacter litoris]
MLPAALTDALAAMLGTSVRRCEPVGGGCIALACRVETAEGSYFLKWGRGDVARTFWAEADGLRALHEAASPLLVPEVLALGDPDEATPGFLLMTWIEAGTRGPGFWEAFGRGLAHLHRHTAGRYGFDEDNFIGRLPQHNAWADDWPAFFRERRLEPQVRWARERGRWHRRWDRPLERLYARLDDLLPARPEPSLLHGDLWSGNVMTARDGRAALIDPAVYFGHREADLAMTELFGGFNPAFYAAYREAWPLEPGYAERRAVYNLYHLLNHLNHFGEGYAGSVAEVLDRFA